MSSTGALYVYNALLTFTCKGFGRVERAVAIGIVFFLDVVNPTRAMISNGEIVYGEKINQTTRHI
jgi:hypothetical protein